MAQRVRKQDRPVMTRAMPDVAGNLSVASMQAIIHDVYGAAPEDVLRLGEVARPAAGEGEVLVRVRAASVDRGTWHVMAGLPYPIRLAGFGLPPPQYRHPGRNLAGAGEAVGAHRTPFAAGGAPVRLRRAAVA